MAGFWDNIMGTYVPGKGWMTQTEYSAYQDVNRDSKYKNTSKGVKEKIIAGRVKDADTKFMTPSKQKAREAVIVRQNKPVQPVKVVPTTTPLDTPVNPGTVGGKFIPTDIEQVREFQKSIGVEPDGKIGNITRTAAAKKGFTIAPSKFDYKGKSGGKQPTEKPVVMKDKEGLAYNLVGQDRRPGKDEELPAGMVLDKNGNAQMVYNPANSDYARTVQATKEATLQNQIERDAYNKMYGAGGSPMESGYEPEETLSPREQRKLDLKMYGSHAPSNPYGI